MSRPTCLEIDLTALNHNVERVRHFSPASRIIAMVKANAYGHGLVAIAKAIKSVDALGVACIEEAMALREAGVKFPIILIEGVFQPDELTLAAQHDFALVVRHLPQLEMLESSRIRHPFPVWLKVNTGMHRLGITTEELPMMYERLQAAATVKKPIGLMTHFAEADMLQSQATESQIKLFDDVTQGFPGNRSLANSAGILAWPDSHAGWVRPGLMLYGASPFADKTGEDHGLLPVMTFKSELIAIVPVKKGGKVGYGGTWKADKDMLIGVVGAGYGDGYPQGAPNGTPVLVNGEVCPLVGRVSMDMLTVDLSNQPDAKLGDSVVLWGKGLPVEKVAKLCHSSAYELLTRMTVRPKIKVIR